MKPLRTAILGCGSFAHRHAGNLVKHPDELELVAFCDRYAENAQSFAAAYAAEAAIHTDVHTLLPREGLDLLVICLPPFAHTDEVEAAAAYGVHILMEKPTRCWGPTTRCWSRCDLCRIRRRYLSSILAKHELSEVTRWLNLGWRVPGLSANGTSTPLMRRAG